jgi:hypothetical protein
MPMSDPAARAGDPPPPKEILGGTLADLIGESRALRADVHSAETARKLSSKFMLALLALVACGLVLLFALSVQNNQLAREVKATNARMADCTTPGGHCYEQSNRRTGKAIGDIIHAEVFMAECARLYPDQAGPAYDAKLEACVAQRLAAPPPASLAPSPAPGPVPSTRGK